MRIWFLSKSELFVVLHPRLDDVQHTIFSYNVPCNGLESGDMEVQPSYEQLAQLMLDTGNNQLPIRA